MKSGFLEINIAGLITHLEGVKHSETPSIPNSYLPFVNPFSEHITDSTIEKPKLNLTIHDLSHIDHRHAGELVLYQTEAWSLSTKQDRLIFTFTQSLPPKTILIEPGFTHGEVYWDKQASALPYGFPLECLDIRLFINWLGEYGDLILHASGVSASGVGLCFAGQSGAGKSTLAAQLSNNQALRILGEDNLIVRYLEGAFWVFGSPWHLNPAMCSPRGFPLQKLFFLTRQAERGIRRLSSDEGITRLLQTAFIPYYRPAVVEKILGNLARLAKQVPFYDLSYHLGDDVWQMINAV